MWMRLSCRPLQPLWPAVYRLLVCAVICAAFAVQDVQAENNPAAPVVVAKAELATLFHQFTITGSATSAQVAKLSPAISGLLAKLYVEAGDRVAAGDAIVQLDNELAVLQLKSARAKSSQAKSALSDALRRLQEAKRLGPQRGIAETEVRTLESEVALDRAALAQANADVEHQQAIVNRHRLLAPFAGVISQKLTEQGEWVTPGQGVVELVATDLLRVEFEMAEDYLVDLSKDATVELTLPALSRSTVYNGRVDAIVPVSNPGARTFLLRVTPLKPIPQMIPGMSVSARVKIPSAQQGVLVSRDATLRQTDGRVVVWTVEDGGTGLIAQEKTVQIGKAVAGKVEITSGLEAGSLVVIRGNESLRHGQTVRIIPSEG